jgi:hypothetical protein
MNRIILGGQVVGVVALLVLRTLLKRHHRGWALRQNRKTHRRR